jgi:hypothetical protein
MATLWENDKDRFIATGPFDDEMPHYYIIISDFRWWAANEPEIYRWMDQCLPRGREHQQGMVVVIENESDASNFLLRWNG